jgi:hypothetical protein
MPKLVAAEDRPDFKSIINLENELNAINAI